MTLPDINDAKKAYRVAAKLRDKKKRGKELTPDQVAWLGRYEAAHPSARVKPPTHAPVGGAASLTSEGAAAPHTGERVNSPNPADAAPSGTSFSAGGGSPPPIDLSGAPTGAGAGASAATPVGAPTQPAVNPDHEKQCTEMAMQFVGMLHMAGEKIREHGGVGLSEMTLNMMVGPSAKRLLMRYLPQGGETSHYLDVGVVGGSIAYLGYQGYMVVKRKKDDDKTAQTFAATVAAAPPVAKNGAQKSPVPNDIAVPMPHKRIDPSTAGDDEEVQRRGAAHSEARNPLTA